MTMSDKRALDLAIFAINTWIEPSASCQSDLDDLDREAEAAVAHLAGIRERLEIGTVRRCPVCDAIETEDGCPHESDHDELAPACQGCGGRNEPLNDDGMCGSCVALDDEVDTHGTAHGVPIDDVPPQPSQE